MWSGIANLQRSTLLFILDTNISFFFVVLWCFLKLTGPSAVKIKVILVLSLWFKIEMLQHVSCWVIRFFSVSVYFCFFFTTLIPFSLNCPSHIVCLMNHENIYKCIYIYSECILPICQWHIKCRLVLYISFSYLCLLYLCM